MESLKLIRVYGQVFPFYIYSLRQFSPRRHDGRATTSLLQVIVSVIVSFWTICHYVFKHHLYFRTITRLVPVPYLSCCSQGPTLR